MHVGMSLGAGERGAGAWVGPSTLVLGPLSGSTRNFLLVSLLLIYLALLCFVTISRNKVDLC